MSKTKTSRRKLLYRCATGAAVLALTVTAWLGYRAISYKHAAQNLSESLGTFTAEIADGDIESARITALSVRDQANALNGISQDPLWKIAAKAPMAGPNFHALSEVAVSLGDLINAGAIPILDKIDPEDYERLKSDPFNAEFTWIRDLAPTIESSASAVQLSYDRLSLIDETLLIDPVSGPLSDSLSALDGVRHTMNSLAVASKLLPSMMGVEGAREYLVLIQNNAEARATGGIPGALVVLRVENGQFSFSDQASAEDLGIFNPPMDVDPIQAGIFSARVGTHMQNVNLTPDFPTAGSTALKMWEERKGGDSLDGVLALDPVVLSLLMEVTGPLQLEDPTLQGLLGDTNLPRELTADNVIPTLLSSVYAEIDEPAVQDMYFAAVAERVFQLFNDTRGDGPAAMRLFDRLRQGVAENRIMVWSSRPEEQRLLATTPLSGSVTAHGAAFGMYFNDGTGAKMDYYAERSVQLEQQCPSAGSSNYTLRVMVKNTAPSDAAMSLPAYVTGNGSFGVAPGNVRTNYVSYGPVQSLLQSVYVNGEAVPFASAIHSQRPVGTVTVELKPGESAELEFSYVRVVQVNDPELAVTPAARPASGTALPLIRDSSCRRDEE